MENLICIWEGTLMNYGHRYFKVCIHVPQAHEPKSNYRYWLLERKEDILGNNYYEELSRDPVLTTNNQLKRMLIVTALKGNSSLFKPMEIKA